MTTTTKVSSATTSTTAIMIPAEITPLVAVDEETEKWKQQHTENMKRRRQELLQQQQQQQEQECNDNDNNNNTNNNNNDRSVRRADAIATECRNRLIASIRKIATDVAATNQQATTLSTTTTSRRTTPITTPTPTYPRRICSTRKLGLLLSGGVDSSAILEAAALIGVRLEAAITVVIIDDSSMDTSTNTTSRPPEDELYATEAARLYNNNISKDDDDDDDEKKQQQQQQQQRKRMKHSIVRLSPAQLVEGYSHPTIRTLQLWGYMETRNSLIISAAFHEATKLGLTDVLVGDNADELFGGSYDVYFHEKYSNDSNGWKQKRDGMARLPFVTQKLATSYNGIQVHQPFRDPQYVEWALQETTHSDCILSAKRNNNTCYIQSKFGGPYESQQNCGKIPLREAFCTVASWRRMDWIFRGSGAAEGNILVDYYNNSSSSIVGTTGAKISDAEFQLEQHQYQTQEGISLQSKEHLYNIRIFQAIFGGLIHPTKARYPVGDSRGCISCCFEIGEEQFCHLCDAYPAQHIIKSTTT